MTVKEYLLLVSKYISSLRPMRYHDGDLNDGFLNNTFFYNNDENFQTIIDTFYATADHNDAVTNEIVYKYGSRKIDVSAIMWRHDGKEPDDAPSVVEFEKVIQGLMKNYVRSNMDAWQHRLQITGEQYNIVDNVSEHTVERHDVNFENTVGGGTDELQRAQRKETLEHSRNYVDNSAPVPNTKDENVSNAYTDKNIIAQRTNKNEGYEETTIDRNGNIGTISASELIEKEEHMTETVLYFHDLFIKELVESITLPCYE